MANTSISLPGPERTGTHGTTNMTRQLFIGALAFLALESLVLAQVFFAHQDHLLTVTEMQQSGLRHGMPLIWHFGIWGDFVAISPLVTYIFARYYSNWEKRYFITSVILSFCAAITMGVIWSLGNVSGAHILDHRTTYAGVFHLLYMWLALSVIVAFYFATPNVSSTLVVIVSLVLLVHVFFGTHLALGLLKGTFDLSWYPSQPLRDPLSWITFLSAAVFLAFRSTIVIQGNKPIPTGTYDCAASKTQSADPNLEERRREIFKLEPGGTVFEILARFEWIWKYALPWGGLIGILQYKTNWSRYFNYSAMPDTQRIYSFFLGEWKSIIPATLVIYLYWSCSRDGRLMSDIGKASFSGHSKIIPWDFISARYLFTIVFVLNVLLFVFLSWSVDRVLWFTVGFTLFFTNACGYTIAMRRGIKQLFSFERFRPKPANPSYDFIMRRRIVVEQYFNRPHLARDLCMIVFSALAIAMVLANDAFDNYALMIAPYAIIVNAMLNNEITIWSWRWRRGAAIDAIDREEIIKIQAELGEHDCA